MTGMVWTSVRSGEVAGPNLVRLKVSNSLQRRRLIEAKMRLRRRALSPLPAELPVSDRPPRAWQPERQLAGKIGAVHPNTVMSVRKSGRRWFRGTVGRWACGVLRWPP